MSRKFTAEHIEKLRKSHLGYKMPREQKKKISEALKGKMPKFIPNTKGMVRSIEFKKRLSEANKGKHLSEETKKKIGDAHRDKKRPPFSEETKKKMGEAKKGKKHSEETKQKISEAHKGEKHFRWIKDRTKLKKNPKKHLDCCYMDWVKKVRERDKWKCKLINDKCKGRLESHHIFNWGDYLELRYDINNGITLCQAHHPRGRAKEKLSIPIFQELITSKE